MNSPTRAAVAAALAAVAAAHAPAQPEEGVALERLSQRPHKRRLPQQFIRAAEAALARYPLGDNPSMWTELAGACAVAARAALDRGAPGEAASLIGSYARDGAAWPPGPAGNVLRACQLRATAAESGSKSAAGILDGYMATGGVPVWADKGLDMVLIAAAEVLEAARRSTEVDALFTAALVAHPKAVASIARAEYEFHTSRGDHARALQAARLGFAFCPYRDRAIQRWARRVARAFSASGRAGESAAFARAQTEQGAPNPLQNVRLPELSEEQMQFLAANAEGDPKALAHAHLLLGEWDKAVAAAAKMLADGRPQRRAAGIRLVAKCFKAKDLNLIRANQFIEYCRTGEGENPVKTF